MQTYDDCRTAVIYHEMYDGRGFSRLGRSWERYRQGLARFAQLGLIDPNSIPDGLTRFGDAVCPPLFATGNHPPSSIAVFRPEAATVEELETVHSPAHIQHILEMDAKGEGYFDRNDTPAWPGVYRRAALAVGGTLLGADMIARGETPHVFHVAGGLHHAHYERVSGFCIFNDMVAAVRRWQRVYGFERIAILDVDGHHGDGTQSLLYHEPVLTISLHQYDGRFFPGTGALDERGAGAGRGYALNLPLPRYSTDSEYLPALEIALAELEAYRPQAIILQYGVDGHYTDRMVGLKLSTFVYEAVVQRVHALAHRVCGGRLLVVGGGGYEPDAVARCWSILAANLSGWVAELGQRYTELHDLSSNLPPPEPAAVEKVNRLLQVVQQML